MTTNAEPLHKLTVKIVDSLRTIQGYTLMEYQQAREELMEDMKNDLECVQMAKAVSNATPLTHPDTAAAPAAPAAAPVAAPAAPSWGAVSPPPAPSFQQAAVPQCAHGPRTARSGASAKGPWKAWFCPQPKGTAQCDAQWIQRGTPEWDTFPA